MVVRPKGKPQSEAFLADNSELGSDGASALPTRLGRYEKAHRRALLMSDYAISQGDIKLSSKLNKCGHWLVFRHYYTVDKLRLASADFCKKHLHCPLCAIRRAAKMLKAYLDKLNHVLAEHPGLKAYFVTVTVKDGECLRERFNHLRVAMKAMTQARRNYLMAPNKRPHVEFAKAVGGVHSIEAKRGKNSRLWHPHAHMIWLCYEEPDQDKLSEQWQNWTQDSFIVDVRPFADDNDLVSGFCEVFKYAIKFSELPLEENWEAANVLAGQRLVDNFGVLRGVEVPEDLNDELINDLPYVELIYQFMGGKVGYSLARQKHVDVSLISRSRQNTYPTLLKRKVNSVTETHQSRVYLAPSGQWTWVIVDPHGEEVVRGAGYETEHEAQLVMEEHFQYYVGPPRDSAGSREPVSGGTGNEEGSTC